MKAKSLFSQTTPVTITSWRRHARAIDCWKATRNAKVFQPHTRCSHICMTKHPKGPYCRNSQPGSIPWGKVSIIISTQSHLFIIPVCLISLNCHISSTWMPFTALKALARATLHSPGMYGSQLPSLDLLKANISPLQPLFPVSKCCIRMKLQRMTVAQQTTSQAGEWLVKDQINQLTPPASSGPHSDITN